MSIMKNKIKLVLWDVDDTLLHLDRNKIKNSDQLLPLLWYAQASKIDIGIITNRTPGLDGEELTPVAALRKQFQDVGIYFDDDLVTLADHETTRERFDKLKLYEDKDAYNQYRIAKEKIPLSSEDIKKKVDGHIAGKNYRIRKLRRQHQAYKGADEKLLKDQVLIVDDKETISTMAVKAGFKGIKATDPKELGADYLNQVGWSIGLQDYVKDLLAQPEAHQSDPPIRKAAALDFYFRIQTDPKKSNEIRSQIKQQKEMLGDATIHLLDDLQKRHQKLSDFYAGRDQVAQDDSLPSIDASTPLVDNFKNERLLLGEELERFTTLLKTWGNTIQDNVITPITNWIKNKTQHFTDFIQTNYQHWRHQKSADNFLSTNATPMTKHIRAAAELLVKDMSEFKDYDSLNKQKQETHQYLKYIYAWKLKVGTQLKGLGVDVDTMKDYQMTILAHASDNSPEFRLQRYYARLQHLEEELHVKWETNPEVQEKLAEFKSKSPKMNTLKFGDYGNDDLISTDDVLNARQVYQRVPMS